MLMKKCSVVLLVVLMAAASFAAETLFSNYALNVNEAGKTGALWVFSRGDIYSGATLLTLNLGTSGVQVTGSEQGQVSDSMTAVQDGIFSDVLAEHRRTPSVYAGKLGYVLPMVGLDDEGNHLQPSGFLSVRGVDNIVETPFEVFEAMEDIDSAMHYAVSGFAYDSVKNQLWMARGAAGLGLYDFSGKGSAKKENYVLNTSTETLELAKLQHIDTKKTAIVNEKYKSEFADVDFSIDSTDLIEMTYRKGDTIKYKSSCKGNRLAVFSETFYPKGWKARIDGEKASFFRCNYILRGMIIPAGEHEIEFSYMPKTAKIGGMVSLICNILTLTMIAFLCTIYIIKKIRRKKTTENIES